MDSNHNLRFSGAAGAQTLAAVPYSGVPIAPPAAQGWDFRETLTDCRLSTAGKFPYLFIYFFYLLHSSCIFPCRGDKTQYLFSHYSLTHM